MSETDENQKAALRRTPAPLLDQIRTKDLTELARKRFAQRLSDAELNVLQDSASSRDPYRPHTNTPRPEIRPELIHWLASDPEAVPFIDPKGIRALHITLPSVLNLGHCHITVPLDFRRSTIKGGINLQSAVTRDIYLWECTVEGTFEADGISAHGPIFLKDSGFSDTIQLRGAWIKGDLDCSGSKLDVSEGDALDAEGAKIGGNVILSTEFTSSGTIKLPGARIKGDLNCRGAKLNVNEGDDALVAYSAKIGGNVILSSKFECSGRIWLLGARIGGQLSFWKARVAEVDCRNLEISTDLVWVCIQKTENTSLDLTGVKVKNLREDKQSWPEAGKLHLDGMVYEEVTLHQRPTNKDNKALVQIARLSGIHW